MRGCMPAYLDMALNPSWSWPMLFWLNHASKNFLPPSQCRRKYIPAERKKAYGITHREYTMKPVQGIDAVTCIDVDMRAGQLIQALIIRLEILGLQCIGCKDPMHRAIEIS